MAKTQSGILIKGVEIAGDVPTACTTMWAPCVLTTLLKYTSETTVQIRMTLKTRVLRMFRAKRSCKYIAHMLRETKFYSF